MCVLAPASSYRFVLRKRMQADANQDADGRRDLRPSASFLHLPASDCVCLRLGLRISRMRISTRNFLEISVSCLSVCLFVCLFVSISCQFLSIMDFKDALQGNAALVARLATALVLRRLSQHISERMEATKRKKKNCLG